MYSGEDIRKQLNETIEFKKETSIENYRCFSYAILKKTFGTPERCFFIAGGG